MSYMKAILYDHVPDADVVAKDIEESVRENVFQPICEKLRKHDDADNYSLVLHQVLSAVHSELVKTLNIIKDHQEAIKVAIKDDELSRQGEDLC